MREDDTRQRAVFPWCDTPGAAAYAVGDAVRNDYKPPSCGAVVSVDTGAGTMEVKWSDGSYAITYPLDAGYLRKKYPWE